MERNEGERKGKKEKKTKGGEKSKEKDLEKHILCIYPTFNWTPSKKKDSISSCLKSQEQSTWLRLHTKSLTGCIATINEQSIVRNLNIP